MVAKTSMMSGSVSCGRYMVGLTTPARFAAAVMHQDQRSAFEGLANNVARFDAVDCDLGGWDAAQCACGHGHVGGQRLRR